MVLDDDDIPTATPLADPSPDAEGALTADEALEEEAQDYRLFLKTKNISAQTIRKGEKDFESHGTAKQENALEQSRQAMQEVLSYTRSHRPQNWQRAWYFPDWWADYNEEEGAEKVIDGEKRPYGHIRERVVLLESSSATSQNFGRAVTGQPKDAPARSKDWLLPEEALYLIERGSLDLWWPTRSLEELFPPASVDVDGEASADLPPNAANESPSAREDDEYEKGFPLSLQAAYSLLVGDDGERGKISLQKFQVYSNLKRASYQVHRAPPTKGELQISQPPAPTTLWQWFSSLLSPERKPQPFGPLVQPGLYRSYVPIYKQMAIIPRHKPSTTRTSPFEASDPFALHFYLWKPAAKWSKIRHPAPDFYVSVVDAQGTDVPTFEEITALIDTTPPAPGKSTWKGPGLLYPRLKHGHRNVIVAVVDHGVINYMRFAEGAFGEEQLFERFDTRNSPRGGKVGGRGGRGGNRGGRGGRGRGKGRGGR
ncbi:putative tRNA-splicing endonuclease subunit [Podospora aff. communis PSN243]|uniref:tRNA-splicing endonuclease subunit n=1 Tax=Podospora aff. communis PSN243 TaxID=3040156 RepID=A0AAV9H5E9_9PEZI|nr:putative tRNA-splicing endonuclease subunit [Podospora aff. communis PSN243]